jgi:PPOX class probable F420-dependent enzyme
LLLDDPEARELLEEPNLARLAYIGRDGRPRVVPIWFTCDGEEIVMVTGPHTEKARALRQNGAVALSIDSSRPPYEVLLLQGDAALEDADGMAPEYAQMGRRYLGQAADRYLAGLRVKRLARIRVAVGSFRISDFVRRYPRSLR